MDIEKIICDTTLDYFEKNFDTLNIDEIFKLVCNDRQKYSKLYELSVCFEYKMILWNMLPNETLNEIKAPRYSITGEARDMGVDCTNLDLTQIAQAKFYGPNSSISWAKMMTFYGFASFMCSSPIGTEKRIVAYPGLSSIGTGSENIPTLKYEVHSQDKLYLFIQKVINKYNNLPVVNNKLPTIIKLPKVIKKSSEVIDNLDEKNSNNTEVLEQPKFIHITKSLRDYQIKAIDVCINKLYSQNNDNHDDIESEDSSVDEDFDNNNTEKEDFENNEIENEDINNDYKICKLQIACGLGKTYIIAGLLTHLITYLSNTSKYLILVPSIILLHQIKKELLSYNLNLSIGLIGDLLNEQDKLITICTNQSMDKLEGKSFELIVVDEAHHLEGFNKETKWRQHLKNITTSKYVLLSATLEDENVDVDYDMQFGIKNKYIADSCLVIPVFKENIGGYMEQYPTLLKRHPEFKHTLAYCNSKESGKKFNEILNNSGIKSIYFDGETDVKIRQQYIKEFENSKYQVMVTINTLNEGINIPIANTCLFVEQRESAINIIQCIGRVSRLHDTKTISYIILPSANEEKDLNKFIKTISKYDSYLRNTKSFGSKISFLYDLIEDDIKTDDINIQLLYENKYSLLTLLQDDWFNMYNKLVLHLNLNNNIS